MLKSVGTIILSVFVTVSMFAEVTIPNADVEGAQDNPLVGRFADSLIVSATQKDFDELTLPLSVLEPLKGQKDQYNNTVYEPQQKKTVAGKRTRLVYLAPTGTSSLDVLRNYQQELSRKGGTSLFECAGKECGGSPERSSSGGGGAMSLAMYLCPEESIRDAKLTAGYCAQAARITEQRYTVMELPRNGAYVSVLTYVIAPSTGSCKVLKDRTIAVVDILEVNDLETKMVTINAEEMAQEISTNGSVALYGIYFDSGKADVKPDSKDTLDQIAELLTTTPNFNLLVVGHTDHVGSFAANLELSKRRAEAVVNLLVATYRIDKNRLTPVGVSFACPVASNTTEEGRAKNRRVELVEN